MKTILEKLSIIPFKIVILRTGIKCLHYKNGNIKTILNE